MNFVWKILHIYRIYRILYRCPGHDHHTGATHILTLSTASDPLGRAYRSNIFDI